MTEQQPIIFHETTTAHCLSSIEASERLANLNSQHQHLTDLLRQFYGGANLEGEISPMQCGEVRWHDVEGEAARLRFEMEAFKNDFTFFQPSNGEIISGDLLEI